MLRKRSEILMDTRTEVGMSVDANKREVVANKFNVCYIWWFQVIFGSSLLLYYHFNYEPL